MKALLVIAMVFAAQVVQQPYSPSRLGAGSPPGLAQQAIGGGQAFVELSIDAKGAVTSVTPLRNTPPFSSMLISSVKGWRFTPALDDPIGADGRPQGLRAVPSKVLVAALYRPPTLLTPTLGELPVDVASPSPEVPFPSDTSVPSYPPRALFGGVVLVEARLDAKGAISMARVLSSAPPFDEAALEAARQWHFSPPRVSPRQAETYVYLIFGFPQPITGY